MEASVSGLKTSRKENKVLKGREDRISGLTNDILVRILSLLPTKYTVRTSVLSTRWKSLWASIPVLILEDDCDDSNNFMNFVDRVLLLHDLPFLYKFSLQFTWRHDPYRINSWIFTALKRNVQELHLCIKDVDPLPLPRNLFTSHTITILKVISSSGSAVTKIPTTVCLPNLKVLRLDPLTFSTHQSNQRVSFRLPMLQKFELYSCEWIEMKSVEIVAPVLERLVFHDYFGGYDGQEIKVYAESLKSLELISELANYLIISNLNSLAMASIYVTDYLFSEHHYITNIFREISKVNHLRISDFPFKFISQAENLPHLLKFSSLIHFEVDIGLNGYFDEGLYTISSEKLIDILCLLPTVEYFQFHNYYWECALLDSEDVSNKVASQCSLTHLKLARLKNFHGSKNELVLVEGLLNNARALNEISITSRPELLKDSKKHMEIAKKLQMFTRESNCVIHFS